MTIDEVQAALLDELSELLPFGTLDAGSGGSPQRVPLVDCWRLTA